MTSDETPRYFWQMALTDLERQLGAGPTGLGSAEAAARQLRYGANALDERRRLSLPLKFLGRFRNPLVIILLVAATISALTGDLASIIIISTIVLMSAAGIPRRGVGQDLVPGDVVLLPAGDLVPADGRLLDAMLEIFSSTKLC